MKVYKKPSKYIMDFTKVHSDSKGFIKFVKRYSRKLSVGYIDKSNNFEVDYDFIFSLLEKIDSGAYITLNEYKSCEELLSNIRKAYSSIEYKKDESIIPFKLLERIHDYMSLNVDVILDKKSKFDFQMWLFYIGLETNILSMEELSQFLDKELLNDNDSDILLELQFELSKGIKNAVAKIRFYVQQLEMYQEDYFKAYLEQVFADILLKKYDSGVIDKRQLGLEIFQVHRRYYNKERMFIFGNEYEYIDLVIESMRKVSRSF